MSRSRCGRCGSRRARAGAGADRLRAAAAAPGNGKGRGRGGNQASFHEDPLVQPNSVGREVTAALTRPSGFSRGNAHQVSADLHRRHRRNRRGQVYRPAGGSTCNDQGVTQAEDHGAGIGGYNRGYSTTYGIVLDAEFIAQDTIAARASQGVRLARLPSSRHDKSSVRRVPVPHFCASGRCVRRGAHGTSASVGDGGI